MTLGVVLVGSKCVESGSERDENTRFSVVFDNCDMSPNVFRSSDRHCFPLTDFSSYLPLRSPFTRAGQGKVLVWSLTF